MQYQNVSLCDKWENNEKSVLYLVGTFRTLTSVISIISSLSIIVSAAVRKQVSNSNVHPILVLSLCDCLLSLLWLAGSGILLTPSHGTSKSCITISTLTVILQCITINITLVYSLIAYLQARQATDPNIMTLQKYNYCYCVGYLTACILPFVIVLVPFGAVISLGDLVQESSLHTCGCFPDFSNLLPHLNNRTYRIGKYQISVMFAGVIITHYIAAFPLLCAMYCKVLQLFKQARRAHRLVQRVRNSFAEQFMNARQRQAQKAVTAFLLMFVVSRACNLVLAVMAVVVGALQITDNGISHSVTILEATLLVTQSITTPLQGCLNAVVYGWTRGTFRHLMLSRPLLEQPQVSLMAVDYGSLR